ncbi:MAG TPA: hypothetical protein PLA24_09320 [Tenuifilaceae bacterium]|nr:hypothetical protein [Tenuifilaceae bacterium]
MFRIRQVLSDSFPKDKWAIEQVKDILKSHFAAVDVKKFDQIPDQLVNPLKYKFATKLFVADDLNGAVKGFALLFYAPDVNFCFLDYIATRKDVTSGGIGSALYLKVRDESINLHAAGLFFECLPDTPELCKLSNLLEENKKRLKFYEQFGARPIINTKYETPLSESDDCPPYLVFDNLGNETPLTGKHLKKIVLAILERKYSDLCPYSYIDMVVKSIPEGPVVQRDFLYIKREKKSILKSNSQKNSITLVVNDKHTIHHVRERGYVEAPVRIKSIKKELDKTNYFFEVEPKAFPEHFIKEVHSPALYNYLKNVCKLISPTDSLYPYVFPIRNANRPPKDKTYAAGYYCIDTFTPITQNAFLAAKRGVDCSLTAAESVLEGMPAAYALIRPPGHHAEKKVFGGFCYFNNCAIAANMMADYGKVAILDIDYHHGNGEQDIFYSRNDVLTISIHGHPSFAYPYFSGYENEKGEGLGFGYNINIPLPENVIGVEYRKALSAAISKIKSFKPQFLVVALGLDIAKGDPTGSWTLNFSDFFENGAIIGSLNLPTLFIQEGGYRSTSIGVNARNFFKGFVSTHTSFKHLSNTENGNRSNIRS